MTSLHFLITCIQVNTTCIIGLSHKEVVGLIRQSNEAVRNY